MMYDLVVSNARIVLPGEAPFVGSLCVKNGRVAAIVSDIHKPAGHATLDANGMTMIPGVVDVHSHYGLGAPDDFATESAAAVRAGITSTLSYLIQPDADYATAFEEARALGGRQSYADFGFHFGVSSKAQADSFESDMRDFGVTSHKFFTSFKREGEGSYIGVNAADDGVLFHALRRAAALKDVTLIVHSETIEIVWTLAAELEAGGVDGLAAWDASRPDFTEADSIASVGLFARITGSRVYIPHVSSAMGLDAVRSFGRNRPLVETCPHYLAHSSEEAELGSLGKVNPPLRPRSDVDALWNAVFDGTVDVIASDHNSRPRARKSASIWKSSAGFPSQGTMMPVVMTAGVRDRGLPIGRAVELLCSAPAQVFGRYPQKGTLLPGSDADFVLIDLESVRTPDVDNWGSASDYSLDERSALTGWPVATYRAGSCVWSDSAGWAKDGATGRYLPGGQPTYRLSGRVS